MYIYIRSMSEAQSKIYDRLTSHVDELDKHIIKLLLYPSSQYVSHWQHEIYSFVNIVHRLKSNNKLPTKKFIKQCLAVANDSISILIWQTQAEEDDLVPREVGVDISVSMISDILVAYQDWLAEQLSLNGAVIQQQVRSKLIELVNQTL